MAATYIDVMVNMMLGFPPATFSLKAYSFLDSQRLKSRVMI